MAVFFSGFSTITIVCDVCHDGQFDLDTSHIPVENYRQNAIDAILDEALMRGWAVGNRHECNCTRQ